ncbi:MAG: alpha/beta fold hydrolase [Bacteroidia bacterium]
MKKLVIVLLTWLPIAGISQNALSPEMLWKLGRISNPRVSPDGKMVLYSIRNFNVAENKGNSDINLLSLAEGIVIKLCSDVIDETDARWQPDGKKITFLTPDKNGTIQLWEINVDGSAKTQITFLEKDVNGYGFAGSGNRFWFYSDVKTEKFMGNELYPDLPKATARVYDDLMYRHWNVWNDGAYSHIFTAELTNGKIQGTPVDVMAKEPYESPLKPNGGSEQIDISPDGKWIAYTCKKLSGAEYAASTNSEIYLYETGSGKTTNLTQGMDGYDVNPRFSPDGKKIQWLSMAIPTYEADRNRIFVYDFTSKEKKELTTGFDYSVEQADWNKDGNLIYFISGINATDQVWAYDFRLRSGLPIRQITSDVADYQSFTHAGSGKETVMIAARMSISQPTELFKINVQDGSATQITFTNKNILGSIKMGKVEKRMVKATDGKEILTWVIYPPNFDASKKYPTLLYCQGGPQSTVSQFFSYRWNFQLMAANGYIVVAPNRRGLPSFGTEWNRQISGDWGGQCMKDYLSAIDNVSKEPYVNKDKLGAVGASFGGYSVYWLAGHHEKRFKAFISHCGVFDLKSMYGTTEELWFPDFDLEGAYWKNPDNKSFQQFSPNDYINSWDTPILVIHSEKDFRVPLGQGMEAFTAARVQNIPARFLYFPDEGHWVTKPQNSILWQRVFFDWLDKYLK